MDGDRLTDEEVIANCIVTMVGGLETTTNLIGNGMLSLLRNPDQMDRLRGRARHDAGRGRGAAALRKPQPAHRAPGAGRRDAGRQAIRKRQAVIAVMAAGNRDPERFPDPDRLDFDRPDNRHLAFGWAAHFCFGAPLARIEGQIAFDTLLESLPGAADDGRTAALAREPRAARLEIAAAHLQLKRDDSRHEDRPAHIAFGPPRRRRAHRALEASQELDVMPRDDWRNLWLNNPLWPRLGNDWPIGWVLEDGGGRLVGSLVNIPTLYTFRGRELVCANGRGWVATPEVRGFALCLMDEYFNQPGADLFINTTVAPNAAPVLARCPTASLWATSKRSLSG